MDNQRVAELLGKIARQDQAAFQELYKAFSRKVFAYLPRPCNRPNQPSSYFW